MRLYCFRTVCAAVLIGASSMLTMAQRPVSPPAPPESGTSADQSGPPAGAQPVGAPAAGDDAAALAQQLSNPVASLISLPFQSNFDFGMGASGDGMRQTMNIQPVVPVKLNRDWNLISRTVTPIIAQRNVVGTSSQFGIGDVLQSFFISPNSAEPFVWGVGPAILIPTATDDVLGSGKLGLGPTAVVLKQRGGWTVGTLANHIWSVAGDDDRADVNSTFVQPFICYTTRTAWTYTANTE
jgi:hypothetical protein